MAIPIHINIATFQSIYLLFRALREGFGYLQTWFWKEFKGISQEGWRLLLWMRWFNNHELCWFGWITRTSFVGRLPKWLYSPFLQVDGIKSMNINESCAVIEGKPSHLFRGCEPFTIAWMTSQVNPLRIEWSNVSIAYPSSIPTPLHSSLCNFNQGKLIL